MRRLAIAAALLILIAVAAIGWLKYHTSRYDYLISQAAARNGLDFDLVKALIYEESWFRANIKGGAGEVGLMQITAAAAKDFTTHKGFPPISDSQRMEPELNVEIGCWYLKRSMDRYRDSPHPALFALLRYNAGEKRADSWLQLALENPRQGDMPEEDHYLSAVDFPKTRAYARRILERSKSRNYWF
jgi:soluble lytic murein transglycosylase